MTNGYSTQSGYTLVELLVAILLLGFIAAAISSGIRVGSRVWEHSQIAFAQSDASTTAQGMLRLLLKLATPTYQSSFVSFSGTPSEIDFAGPAPQALQMGGLVQFRLTTHKTGTHRQLLLQVTSAIDPKYRRSATLAGDIGDLRFSYLDARQEPSIWLGYWQNRERLPDAVRIEANGKTAWPSQTIAMPIAEPADCNFDPVSLVCRTL